MHAAIQHRIRHGLLFVTFTLSSLSALVASADGVVVPNANATVEGGVDNCIPLSGCLLAFRYQQIYASSQFGALTGPRLITEIRFRPDIGSIVQGPYSISYADIEVNLSTTTIPPAAPSATFDDNIGTDETNVYRGPLTLATAYTGPPTGPLDFDVVIPLQTPFLYDPSQGNLLFEWKNHSGEQITYFFDYEVDASLARIFNLSGDPNGEVGLANPGGGLIAKFVYFSVEEVSLEEELILEDVPIATGSNVSFVNVPAVFKSVAANVVVPGTTTAQFCVGRDPRVIRHRGRTRFVARWFNVSEMSHTGSCGDLSHIDQFVAPWFRGYEGKFPADGGEPGIWFVVANIDTQGAIFAGPIVSEPAADKVIDYTDARVSRYAPECNARLSQRSLSLGGDPDNVEERQMIVDTAQCNAPRSMTRRTTHLYPVRIASNPFIENLNLQLQLVGIGKSIAEARLVCGDPDAGEVLIEMWGSLIRTQFALLFRRRSEAIEHLEAIALAANVPNALMGCPAEANYPGVFIGRSVTAAFTIWDRFLHPFEGGSWDIYRVPAELGLPLLTSDASPPAPIP